MIQSDIQKLEPGALIELFVIDATALGGGVSHFHAGTNSLSQPLVWQGVQYAPFPIKAEGFEYNGRGQSPRPKVTVSDVFGIMSSLNREFDDMVGGKVIRRRTLSQYLDAVNFPGGVNSSADPSAAFPDDIYYVERKISEEGDVCEYELAGIYDLGTLQLPLRQVIANCCTALYLSPECGYTGPSVADVNDNPTGSQEYSGVDDCGRRVASCKLRFGASAELPFAGFPSAGKLTY